jgi:hypothetical protein
VFVIVCLAVGIDKVAKVELSAMKGMLEEK